VKHALAKLFLEILDSLLFEVLHNFFAFACFDHNSSKRLHKAQLIVDLVLVESLIQDKSECTDQIVSCVLDTTLVLGDTPNNLIERN
jgi:hypothetical protein